MFDTVSLKHVLCHQVCKRVSPPTLHRAVVCSNLRNQTRGVKSSTSTCEDAESSESPEVAGLTLQGNLRSATQSGNTESETSKSCVEHKPSFPYTPPTHQSISPASSNLQTSTAASVLLSPTVTFSALKACSPARKVSSSLQHQASPSIIPPSRTMGEPSAMSGPATYTPPMSPLCGRVLSSPLSPSPLPGHLGSSASLFSISPHDAAQLVQLVKTQDGHDVRHCYFIHLKLRTVFSDDAIPGACIRKLPRLLNGIPLGAGFLSRDQISEIRWRLVEGEHSTLTFLSCPLLRDEAEESRTSFRDRLITQAQAVFGDITVRASLTLSKCMDYQDSLVLNDIATNVGDGLQFKD